MKINLWGPFARQDFNKTEEGIEYALKKMGHEVRIFNEETTTPKDLIENKADLLLFFKGGVRFGITPDLLSQTLSMIDYPKACWFWDKIWGDRIEWMEKVAPKVDLAFLSDGTYVRSNNLLNLYELHQGTDERAIFKGKYRKEYEADIAFTGSIYNERYRWYEQVKGMFGSRFKIFKNVWNKDLNDLCATAKIITAPKYPQDDFYSSQRPYEIMGRGGFMLHPYLKCLADNFKEGEEIEFYRNMQELKDKTEFYLANEKERKRIAENGQKKIKEKFTFRDSINDILNTL